MSKEAMHPELKKMWEDYFDKCFAAFAKEHEKAFKEIQQEQGEPVAAEREAIAVWLEKECDEQYLADRVRARCLK